MQSMDEWLTRPEGLSTLLRRLRADAGYTGEQLAAVLGQGWTPSKVSKISTGKQLPTADEVDAWARACRATPAATARLQQLLGEAQGMHREFRQQMRLGQARIQRNYNRLVEQATLLRNAETVFLPGFVQTPGYVRARIEENVRVYGADPAGVDAAVAARLQRQQVLYDPTKRFEIVITEACLRLLLCPVDVMRGQLDRLLSLTDAPGNVTFGVIPFGVPLQQSPHGGFLIFDNHTVAVEDLLGDTMHEGDAAAVYVAAMDNLLAEAVTGDSARHLILDAIDALRIRTAS